ncbi:hypothetical protein [Sphingomonas sp. TZW2008]|uniref:hypothetical protein n=1 Tax=Sphingomonas sp. TZW2008 TaxID=1917973 RepID=UPI0015C51E9B|nr:hypothetical protein [Sphingomonas sp. TZW2008]
MSKVYDDPSYVSAKDGKVLLDGPDGVAVAVTPEAALETSDRLLHKAAEAQGQEVQSGYGQEAGGRRKRASEGGSVTN